MVVGALYSNITMYCTYVQIKVRGEVLQTFWYDC